MFILLKVHDHSLLSEFYLLEGEFQSSLFLHNLYNLESDSLCGLIAEHLRNDFFKVNHTLRLTQTLLGNDVLDGNQKRMKVSAIGYLTMN